MSKIHIPENIMKDMRNRRGLNRNDTSEDQEILSMSKYEFLDEWLGWKGIIGYTTKIMDMIYYAFGIDLESDEVWNTEIERTTEKEEE